MALSCLALIPALVGIWSTTIDLLLQLALSWALVVGLWFYLACLAGKQPDSIRRVQFDADTWWLTLNNGRVYAAQLCGPVVILPALVSVHFRYGRRKVNWVVAADSVTATQHRKLRVALLVNCQSQQSTIARWYQYGVARIRQLRGVVQSVV